MNTPSPDPRDERETRPAALVQLVVSEALNLPGLGREEQREIMSRIHDYASRYLGQSQAASDVLAERRRQVTEEGWTPEHDDANVDGEMAIAAAVYAQTSAATPETVARAQADFTDPDYEAGNGLVDLWPWAPRWFKPKDRRRDLVRAGALIVAEIERLDRLPTPPSSTRTTGGGEE